MGDNEQKAMALMAEAEKKLTTQKGFFGSLFGCVMDFQKHFFFFELRFTVFFSLLTVIINRYTSCD